MFFEVIVDLRQNDSLYFHVNSLYLRVVNCEALMPADFGFLDDLPLISYLKTTLQKGSVTTWFLQMTTPG